jgi:hypothetical protein
MGIKRIVDVSFWTDGKVDDFSPEDKYFMLYLLTNPFSKQLGIYEISIKQAAFQLGYTVDTVMSLLDRFESKYNVIRFSRETNEVAILNFLRHSVMKGGKPVEDCIMQDMLKVKNKKLIDFVFGRLQGKDDLNKTVEKIVNQYISDNDIHNDNDNDNDRTVDDSCNDSYNESCEPLSESPAPKKTKSSKPVKHRYGAYQHVLLTDNERNKLLDDFGPRMIEDAVAFLDEYIEEKGYKSKSHNLAIRRWVIDAVKEKEQKKNKGRKEMVPSWMKKNQFNNFPERPAEDITDLEAALLGAPKTVANDADIRKRAEALKEKLGGA